MLQSLFICNIAMGNICSSSPKVDPDSAWKEQNKESKGNRMYYFANLEKGGCLVETFNKHLESEGREQAEEAVRALVRRDMTVCLYEGGKGKTVIRAEFLRWKYETAAKRNGAYIDESLTDKDLLLAHKEDEFNKVEDHPACWRMDCRGGVGETPIHLLFLMDSYIHTKVGYILLDIFPRLSLDIYEGDEYYGESCLHIAIVYSNFELVKRLVECGANVNQRATGQFFLPEDQKRGKKKKQTNYAGYAYYGEYPLAFAACFGNREIYDYLIEHGADPDEQDSFGNTVLHMAVIADQVEMYKYAFQHHTKPAKPALKNAAKLTPLTLASKLGRHRLFLEMLELSSIESWRYSNVMCSVYPLAPLDTISPTGKPNWESALWFIINGETDEHLDMLEAGVVSQLLDEKWKTFASRRFFERLGLALFHLLMVSLTVYLRPPDNLLQYRGPIDAVRYTSEIITTFGCGINSIMSLLEIRSQGFMGFIRNCKHAPAKTIFLLSCFLMLLCVPFRLLSLAVDPYTCQQVEDTLMIIAVPCAWIFLLFFARSVKLTGPFVTMIYKMCTGDLFRFAIIYTIFLCGFTQGFYFLFRDIEDKSITSFDTLSTTVMTLIQMTLGEFRYEEFDSTHYSFLTKLVFAVFMIIVPILLLNMLIAMMGNTYQQVISKSEKEWRRQWAKIVIVLERAFHKDDLLKFQERYSIKMGKPSNGNTEEDSKTENCEGHYRGLMVIKACNKSKAKQRKGAVRNWKKFGREVLRQIKEKNQEGIKGPLELKNRRKCSKVKRSPSKDKKDGEFRPSSVESGNVGNTILSAMDQLAWEQNLNYVQGQTIQRHVSQMNMPVNEWEPSDTVTPMSEGKPPLDKRHGKGRPNRNQVQPISKGSPVRSVSEAPLLSLPSEASLDFLINDSALMSVEKAEASQVYSETDSPIMSATGVVEGGLPSVRGEIYTLDKRLSPVDRKDTSPLIGESPQPTLESPSRRRKSPHKKHRRKNSPHGDSPHHSASIPGSTEELKDELVDSPPVTGNSPETVGQEYSEYGGSPRRRKKDKKKDRKSKGASKTSLNSASSQTSLLHAQSETVNNETAV